MTRDVTQPSPPRFGGYRCRVVSVRLELIWHPSKRTAHQEKRSNRDCEICVCAILVAVSARGDQFDLVDQRSALLVLVASLSSTSKPISLECLYAGTGTASSVRAAVLPAGVHTHQAARLKLRFIPYLISGDAAPTPYYRDPGDLNRLGSAGRYCSPLPPTHIDSNKGSCVFSTFHMMVQL
jgi:hypothetical protein